MHAVNIILCIVKVYSLLIFKLYLFVYLYLYMRGFCTPSYMWKSEGNFWELLLSSYHMGFGIQTQIISLGSKPLYPVGHLPSPQRLSYSPYYTAITTLDCSSGAYY